MLRISVKPSVFTCNSTLICRKSLFSRTWNQLTPLRLQLSAEHARMYSQQSPPEPEKSKTSPLRQLSKRENIWNLPNILTMSRLVASPVIGWLAIHNYTSYAASLFAYSCLTDFVDGYIARKYKLQTVVGSVIDPMADKALMVTLASCLAVSGAIPVYMAVLILGRDILLGLSAIYYRYISLPPPKTFARYWDFSLPSAEVHPTTISKYNTFLQMIYLGGSLVNPAISHVFSPDVVEYLEYGLKGLEYTVATTTVLSGLSYVFSKDAVVILSDKKNRK